MHASIRAIERHCAQGRFAQAQALAASLFANAGPQPDGAKHLAWQAGKLRDPRLLALAGALWPQALGPKAVELLLAMPPKAAIACARMSAPLSQALSEAASRESKRPAEPAPAKAAPAKAAPAKAASAKNPGAPKPKPTPPVIVRGRRKIKICRLE